VVDWYYIFPILSLRVYPCSPDIYNVANLNNIRRKRIENKKDIAQPNTAFQQTGYYLFSFSMLVAPAAELDRYPFFH
jgi:hypothetical protein